MSKEYESSTIDLDDHELRYMRNHRVGRALTWLLIGGGVLVGGYEANQHFFDEKENVTQGVTYDNKSNENVSVIPQFDKNGNVIENYYPTITTDCWTWKP